MTHSPEPWSVEQDEALCRAVACVNACAGIPTEWLEKYGRKALVVKVVVVERADLDKACQHIASAPDIEIREMTTCPTCKRDWLIEVKEKP